MVLSIKDEKDEDNDEESPKDLTDRQLILSSFWNDFAQRVQFDDSNQLPSNPSIKGYVTLRMPSPRAWILLYFDENSNKQGMELSFNRGKIGDIFYQRFCEERHQIAQELPPEIEWWSDGEKHKIHLRREAPDIATEQGKQAAFEWFQKYSNQFVNAFRPRIAHYQNEL